MRRSIARAALLACSLCAIPSLARADVIHVPGDYATVSEAIEAAADGDVVQLAPGPHDKIRLVRGSETGSKSVVVRGSPDGSSSIGRQTATGALSRLSIGGFGAIRFENITIRRLQFQLLNRSCLKLIGCEVLGPMELVPFGEERLSEELVIENSVFRDRVWITTPSDVYRLRRAEIRGCRFERGLGLNAAGPITIMDCKFGSDDHDAEYVYVGVGSDDALRMSRCDISRIDALGLYGGLELTFDGGAFTPRREGLTPLQLHVGPNGYMDVRDLELIAPVIDPRQQLATIEVGEGATATLRRFVCRGGSSRGPDCTVDGELLVEDGVFEDRIGSANRFVQSDGAVTFRRCVFARNVASEVWGAAVSGSIREAIFKACVFDRNESDGRGGAVWLGSDTATPLARATFDGCEFRGNRSSLRGGAIATRNIAEVTIRSCEFVENSAPRGGTLSIERTPEAGIVNASFVGSGDDRDSLIDLDEVVGRLIGCLMVSGTASGDASVLSLRASTLDAPSCTLVGRSESAAAVLTERSSLAFTNSVVSVDAPPFEIELGSSVDVLHSLVSGGWLGIGNFDAAPRFVDPDGPDDEAATLDDNDYRLAVVSPAIDAGRSSLVPADAFDLDRDGDRSEPWPIDLAGAQRVFDVGFVGDTGEPPAPVVDLGAYESNAVESPACGSADIVGLSAGEPDGLVSIEDFDLFVSLWTSADRGADITRAGVCEFGSGGDGVDLSDFSCYLSEWSLGCP